MDQPPTCGQGIAEHADVPLKLADVIGAMADILEIHQSSLNSSDKHSRPEFDAYVAVATAHRELESRLRALAVRMEGYRDLPMASHDMAVITSPTATRALERLSVEEEALTSLLQKHVKQYRQMLNTPTVD
jgi:hypothetical protein